MIYEDSNAGQATFGLISPRSWVWLTTTMVRIAKRGRLFISND